jgi:alanyl-tRNA synthetase
MQKGSLVEAERLRFDFSHFEPLKADQIETIERLVNEQVRANVAVETRTMAFDDALQTGAVALFGEKYDDQVRVLRMGDFSIELCGGTHVQRLGDIGLFKIVSESGVASGVRRIEAVTGECAVDYVETLQHRLGQIAGLVKADIVNVDEKVQQLVNKSRRLEKEIEQLKSKLAGSQGSDLVNQAIEIDGIKVLAARLDGADAKTLRDTVDHLKSKFKTAAVVLLSAVENGKVRLVAGVTADQTSRIKAGDLVNLVAQQVGGKGGGRADLAQAGGNDPASLNAALNTVPEWVRQQISRVF